MDQNSSFSSADVTLLHRLADRADIIDAVNRFAVAVDTRNWDLWKTLVLDPIEFDYPDSVGSGTFNVMDLIANSDPFFSRLDATQHLSGNHVVTLDGDSAECVSVLHAQHYIADAPGGSVQRQIGYYTNFFRRTPDGWRIWRSEQRVAWTEGNNAVYEAAAQHFS